MAAWLSWFLTFQWAGGFPRVVPMAIAVAVFAGMAAWALLQPREHVLAQAPDRRLWRDLRIWAVVAMAVQVVLYAWLR
jgi:hypothetical protein